MDRNQDTAFPWQMLGGIPPPCAPEPLPACPRLRLIAIVDEVLAQEIGAQQEPGPAALQDATDEHFWCENEGLSSELRFNNQVGLAINNVQQAYSRNDVPGIRSAFRRLGWPAHYLTDETLLSPYDSALAQSAFYITLYFTDRFKTEPAYRLCEAQHEVLTDKKARRILCNLPYRPDSVCWLRLFLSLAELKWKASPSNVDRLLTPQHIVDQYLDCANKLLINLTHHQSYIENHNAAYKVLLGWSALQVLKMSTWLVPNSAQLVLNHFNETHNQRFGLEPGLFLYQRAPKKNPEWFWDYELFKWCMLGPGAEDDALMCFQWRIDSMRARTPDHMVWESFKFGAQLELEFLLRHAKERETKNA